MTFPWELLIHFLISQIQRWSKPALRPTCFKQPGPQPAGDHTPLTNSNSESPNWYQKKCFRYGLVKATAWIDDDFFLSHIAISVQQGWPPPTSGMLRNTSDVIHHSTALENSRRQQLLSPSTHHHHYHSRQSSGLQEEQEFSIDVLRRPEDRCICCVRG